MKDNIVVYFSAEGTTKKVAILLLLEDHQLIKQLLELKVCIKI